METVPAQLPFNEQKQNALLGHLLVDDRWFRICVNRIKPEWFSGKDGNPRGLIWAAKVAFYQKFARAPTHDELRDTQDWKNVEPGEKNAMARVFIEAMTLKASYGIDALSKEMNLWLHTRLFTEGITQAEGQFNAGKVYESFDTMEKKLAQIRVSNFQGSQTYDFSMLRQHAARRKIETSTALTFGLGLMDSLLLPLGEGRGSLLPGDTTILLAATNIGKTTSMLGGVGAANVLRGKSVLIQTHEGVDDDIAEKVAMSLLNVDRERYLQMCLEPTCQQDIDYIDEVIRVLVKHVVYQPMNKAGMMVEEVVSQARIAQEERLAATGQGFDLLINDYPAKLSSEMVRYGQFQKRNLDEYVYNQFVQLALEYKFHALLAIQSNRTGAKINRGLKGVEERLLIPEDANESFGPMQIATNIITANRDPWSEANEFITYYLAKSRSSKKGWAVVCKSNYSHAITHSESLGGFWYRGDVACGPMAEMFYKQFKGTCVNSDTLRVGLSGGDIGANRMPAKK